MRPPHAVWGGWLLALSSTALAIAAHGVAGGGLPDGLLILPLTALIAWGAATIAHRLRGLTLIALLGVIQLVLHFLLTENANEHASHHAVVPAVNGWAMFTGHALATLLTAALLARASTALTLASAALAWLRGRLRQLVPAPVAAPATIGTATAVPARPGHLLEVLLRRAHSRRGPPVRS